MLYAHIWGVSFLGEHEHLGGVAGSLLLAGGVVTVNLSKTAAPAVGPDETTAFVASIESKAVDYNDTRITLGNPTGSKRDVWLEEERELPEVEMTLSRV